MQRYHARTSAILFSITIKHGLPAERDVAAGSESCLIRLGVAFHECGQVARVPCTYLLFPHSTHGGGFVVLSHRHCATACHQSNERHHHGHAGHSSFHFSVHKHEFVAVEEHARQICQSVGGRVGRQVFQLSARGRAA